LRRDDEKGEIGLRLNDVGHAVALDQGEIIPPFPRAVEKQH
jgi:hypothetical protein